ncbi:hypothetical protein SELMODRAFT_425212 [Selaginella moellendorffii]|uniref:Uncharacterized protein n=1 Tax=Selaginella moellendorffii TaxID=88036 RepID=D8SSD3_SELML|nr:hypothetical protein SELMODRAFT_425212 [Selaginella moellendorffii]
MAAIFSACEAVPENVVARSRARVKIDERAARAVEQKLLRFSLLTGDEEDQELTPSELIIGDCPNAEAFSRWESGHKRFICDFLGGKIIARELPNKPHGHAQLKVGAAFDAQAAGLLSVATAVGYRPDVGGSLYVPDVVVNVIGESSILPPGVAAVHEYGAIVIEIATSQRPKNLHERAAIFLGPNYPRCAIYVGLKRFNMRANGTMAMLATVYERPPPPVAGAGGAAGGAAGGGGAPGPAGPAPAVPVPGAPGGAGPMPIRLVSFGTGPLGPNATWKNDPNLTGIGRNGVPLTGPGIAQYVLRFPALQVFSTFVPPGGGGAIGAPPPGAPVDYTLDLFYVKEAFLKPNAPTY